MTKADVVDAATMPTDRRKSGRLRAKGSEDLGSPLPPPSSSSLDMAQWWQQPQLRLAALF